MARAETVHFEKERGVTDVTVQREIAHVTVRLPNDGEGARRRDILKRLAAAEVPIFLLKLLPEGISFGLRGTAVGAGHALLQSQSVAHTIHIDLALVTTFAGAMRDLSGVMATIYEALVAEGIRVRQTGDAYNAVHCLVAGADADRAAAALRNRFALPAVGDASEADTAAAHEGVGLKAL